MFDNQTYDNILAQMLTDTPSTLDKRQGSFIWDCLSPVAIQLALAYLEYATQTDQLYADTASGEWLSRRTNEMGVERLPASHAHGEAAFSGQPGAVIPVSTLVATVGGQQYLTRAAAVIGTGGSATVEIIAVVAGAAGNVPAGQVNQLPLAVPGVTTVINASAIYGGADIETDEQLRQRYYVEIRNQAADGNEAQYATWCNEYQGIGRFKIFPLWAGVNTVKVSILTTANEVAPTGLINEVQEYFDPGQTGLGNGVAPIGAVVTVSTPTQVNINVGGTLTLKEGVDPTIGVNQVLHTLVEYMRGLAYNKSVVPYIGIGAAILAVDEVEQVSNLLVNNGTADIVLSDEQIPVSISALSDWTVTP